MKAKRVALIGLGRIGWKGFDNPTVETHYGCISTYAGMELVAACDSDEATATDFKKSNFGVAVYQDPAVCIARSRPDIVVIATPPETHLPIALRAAVEKCVRGVIIEKPLAPTVAEAEEIVAALREKTLIVGHQRRYEARHRALLMFLTDGNIGQVKAIQAHFGGDYLNNGTHAADLCRFLGGDHVPWSIVHSYPEDFCVRVSGTLGSVRLDSYGSLEPGYMKEMYSDMLDCMDDFLTPGCTGEDGVEAVRHALFAQERDAHAA